MNSQPGEFSGKDRKLYIVGIEWDGQHPPTKWYRRLADLTGGIRARGNDKEINPVTRRYDKGKGALVLQEGMILCQSYYLARELAIYARDTIGWELTMKGGKPPVVYVGEATVSDRFTSTREDENILKRMETTLGKRGKKPGKQWYAVTCMECMEAYDDEVPKDHVVNCPSCGSLKIHWRPGKTRMFKDTGDDILTFWKRTRFHTTHWEPSKIAVLDFEVEQADNPPPDDDDLLIGATEHKAITLIEKSGQVLYVARKLAETDRIAALDFLDAVLVGRTHMPLKLRQKARIDAATQYYLHGGDPQFAIMGELPDEADVLDAATLLGETRVANYMINYLMNGGYQDEA